MTSVAATKLYKPTDEIAQQYHSWYYASLKWKETTWQGVTCWKSPMDMWNYQEILAGIKPSLIVEFGTAYGGSAMYFANAMRQIGNPFRVFTVDIDHSRVDARARQDPDVEFLESSSIAPHVADRINELREQYPGPVFAILDSLHTRDHVLDEMLLLRPLLVENDYLIVEDSNVNGHPVLPDWGPGPYEAIEAYERLNPSDYRHDYDRENKFGWTMAPNGFLIRNR
jgi:cephalosporin hydroxylase